MNLIFKGICALILSIQFVPMLAAEDFGPEKLTQQVKIFDTLVVYPAPSWQDERMLHASEYYRDAKPNSYIIEQIPKGEKFESWTKLYAVAGVKTADLDFKTFLFSTLGIYAQVCGREHLKIQTVMSSQNRTMVIIFCQNSPHGPENLGYGEGKGEITLMLLAKPFGTNLKIYQNWRGEKYDVTDKATWPVSEDELKLMVKRFSSIKAKRVE